MNKPEWMPKCPIGNFYPLRDVGNGQRWAWEEGGKAHTKALIEWLFGTCPHGIGDFRDDDESTTQCFRHACGQCMQQLKEEIKKL